MQMLPFVILPQVDFEKTRQLQIHLVDFISKNELPGIFLVVEHNPVLTLGKSTHPKHLLMNEDFLKRQGIMVYSVERGGDITYHGPGQIVGYPLINLHYWKKDVHLFLRGLEKTLINFLKRFHLQAFCLPPHTGVWVRPNKPEKIAAMGIAVKKWITFHGFALNISTDMKPFTYIVPCGIPDKGVTSLSLVMGMNFSEEDRKKMKKDLIDDFSGVFGYSMIEKNPKIFDEWFISGNPMFLPTLLKRIL